MVGALDLVGCDSRVWFTDDTVPLVDAPANFAVGHSGRWSNSEAGREMMVFIIGSMLNRNGKEARISLRLGYLICPCYSEIAVSSEGTECWAGVS